MQCIPMGKNCTCKQNMCISVDLHADRHGDLGVKLKAN